jgi:hypothetical protein
MAVLKEWVCMAHGDFDSTEAVCPHGCSGEIMVQRAFRTAPMIQSAGYARINSTFDSLAAEQGVTNMSNSSGQQRRADYATHKRLAAANDMLIRNGPRKGQDAGEFFKPVGSVNLATTGGGALQKQGSQTVNSLGVPLSTPSVRVEGRHDGTKAGLPQGDA